MDWSDPMAMPFRSGDRAPPWYQSWFVWGFGVVGLLLVASYVRRLTSTAEADG